MIVYMKRCIVLIACFFALLSCNPQSYIQFGGYAQGGTYTIKCRARASQAPALQKDIDNILVCVDSTLSGYNRNSVLSRLNAGQSVVLPKMFADIYALSYKYWALSGGAFDVSCGPLYDSWGFGFKTGTDFPTKEKIQSLMQRCGMQRLITPEQMYSLVGSRVCSSDFLLDRSAESPVLNFNAIAQGFSCDTIARYLQSRGVEHMLVDIGEIWVQGLNPGGSGWRIAIDNPVDGNNTPGVDIKGSWCSDGRAVGVVTSGNYRKFYIRDGRKYAHTIDPRSGMPVQHDLLCATVIAPDSSGADALATFFMVIGRDQAAAWLSEHPEVDACLISSTKTEWYLQGRLQQDGE